MADKNTALAVKENETEFLALTTDQNELHGMMREVFGSEGLTLKDMERIKLPGAGGTAWTVKSIDGDEDVTKTIRCVILTHRQVRTYWEGEYGQGGAGKPPDCFSPDAVKGIGNPGIECAGCQFAQWKSGKGNGQACQLKRLLFFLLPDQIFPAYVALPPTSQNEGKSYLLGLMSRNLRPYDVVTELTLEQTKNDGGIAYSKVKFKRVGQLDDENKKKMRALAGSLIEAINGANVSAVDVGDEEVNTSPDNKYAEVETEEI